VTKMYEFGRRRPKGFSLIELLVVLVIMGLLAGLVGPRLFGKVDQSKVQTAETQIKMLRGALQTYRLDVGSFPTTAQGLLALQQAPSDVSDYWRGPYLSDDLPQDPWRSSYQYQSPMNNLQGFSLYSYGADSVEGGDGLNTDIGYLPIN
jgi:general secretion pathway protein G